MKVLKLDADTIASIRSEKAHGLTGQFENLRDGKTATQRSPLFKDKSADEVKLLWSEKLSRNNSPFTSLTEYEETRWAKFGPQGAYPPLKDSMEDLEMYFTPRNAPTMSEELRSRLITQTRELLFSNAHDLRALTPEQVLQRDIEESKVDTNSGLPDFSKRSAPEVQSRAVKDAKSGKWEMYPAVLGRRSARLKPRFIFMFPMSTNLVEKQFVLPIMDLIRKNKVLSFSAWEGFDDVEIAMHRQGFFTKYWKAAMDYTKMDTSCRSWAMDFVYDIVAPIFQPKDRPLLKKSLHHVINIPIMIDDNTVTQGEHGIASGSGWTNLVESIVSQGVHLYLEQNSGSQLLGDDGALTFGENLSQEEVGQCISEAAAAFGLTANPEKQRVDRNTVVYLQRFFTPEVLVPGTNMVAGCYPTVLALNSAMHPERFHDPKKWSEKMEILRWIMILENCKHNPKFTELIEFFLEGDRYRLGLSIPGFFKRHLIQTVKEAKTIKGFIPSYTTAHKDVFNSPRGILQFKTVQYLMSKLKKERPVMNEVKAT